MIVTPLFHTPINLRGNSVNLCSSNTTITQIVLCNLYVIILNNFVVFIHQFNIIPMFTIALIIRFGLSFPANHILLHSSVSPFNSFINSLACFLSKSPGTS